MRTSYVVGLSLCLGIGVAFASLGAGCGSSTNRSEINDDTSSEAGGSSSFGGFGDAGDAHPCVGLQCQQKACGGGSETTVTGTVFAPNGTLPLYNAIVYVPNTTPDTLTHGATCDQCGAVTGNPVVTALSNSDGTFTLSNVPVGDNIPLVIQVGKWRRQVTIPTVAACTETPLTAELTRLPKNQSEGDIPRIAMTTGGCDTLGCMLPKVGIDASEFGLEADGPSKSVHVFNGSGGSGPGGSNSAKNFWNDSTQLKQYDLVLLSCECEPATGPGGTKDTPAFAAMTDYLTAGGRIFTTDFMYTWYLMSPDPALMAAATIGGGAPLGGSPMTIDTSFPKGQALSDWFATVSPGGMKGEVTPDVVFSNVQAVTANSQQWATSPDPEGPRVFTVNVPVGVPTAMQCGKGVHIDAHLNSGVPGDSVTSTYPASCGAKLKDGEKLLAFFFFDLASCIQNDTQAPKPPVVK